MREFYSIVLAVGMATLVAVLVGFTFFRLEQIPRSLPLLHAILAIGGLSTMRLAARLLLRERRANRQVPFHGRRNVLVIGFTPLADLFLRTMDLHGDNRIQVVGILDENPMLTGSRMHMREVVGHPRDLAGILVRYRVQGINIRCVVLALDPRHLSAQSREELRNLQQSKTIEVFDFSEAVGNIVRTVGNIDEEEGNIIHRWMETSEKVTKGTSRKLMERIQSRQKRYGLAKRGIDVLGSLLLLIPALPVMMGLLPLVWLLLGTPAIFWQERPGRDGRPFRLYKLRTMRHAVDGNGRVLKEEERFTAFGNFLRRFRLDELPQLFNVLKGDMSFVGPRPLLPVDLPASLPELVILRARLRPGLTGWAQIHGGKKVSAEDKVVMDVWYACNMSWTLDALIMWRTLRVLLVGEELHRNMIKKCWKDLGLSDPQEMRDNA